MSGVCSLKVCVLAFVYKKVAQISRRRYTELISLFQILMISVVDTA
jgi:hypothetical protein